MNAINNLVYLDLPYQVRVVGNEIHVTKIKGKLRIVISDRLLNGDAGGNMVSNIYHYVVGLLKTKNDLLLKIEGENVITLTKDLLSLQGCVSLKNVSINNPVLHNAELLNVDFSKSCEAAVGFSTIKNCKSNKGMALKIGYTNISNQDKLDKFIKKLEIAGN